MKKILIVLGSLLGLFILAIALIPLLVDINKYRPLILEKANDHLNGKLELGKLGLSLWGHVHVDIDGLKLKDAKGSSVLDVKDASLNVPFMSLLSGHPNVKLVLTSPRVNVVKQKNGKLNLMALVKSPGTEGSNPPSSDEKPAESSHDGGTQVPSILLNSRFTCLLRHAKVNYNDEGTGDVYHIEDLNLRLEDVSPSSEMPFEITAELDLMLQNKIKVAGPLMLEGSIKAASSNGTFEKADAKVALKLDGLEIADPGLFHKAKGVTLGADVTATATKDQVSIPVMKLRLASVTIDGSASGKATDHGATLDLKASSNQIDTTKLADLFPLIKEYGIDGLFEFSMSASGPTDKLDYGANLKFKKVSLNSEALKQPLELNGAVTVATNQVKELAMKLTAKDFDLSLEGNLQNFMAPRFKFTLVSENMDLDGLLKSSEKASEARKEKAAASQTTLSEEPKSAQGDVVDYNAMFKPLRENPIAASAAGTLDFNLKRLKSTGIVIDNLKGQLALNNLILAVKDFSMKIFDGVIKGTMSFNAKAPKPEVGTNLTIMSLSSQKMVESQMPIARNTIKGLISSTLNVGGAGLNHSDIVSKWKGSGTFAIKNAVISTLDVGGQIRDGLIAKLPPFAKEKVKLPDSVLDQKGAYDTIEAKFGLNSGILNIAEIVGKAQPNRGLDLKGGGQVRLADYGLDLTLDAIDTYNLLHAEEVFGKDKRYNHFAAQFRLDHTIFSPRFDWGSTLAKLAKGAATQQAKSLIQKQLGDKVPGADKLLNNPKPADAVKALKGLFGH